jgi:hypothetical protein
LNLSNPGDFKVLSGTGNGGHARVDDMLIRLGAEF